MIGDIPTIPLESNIGHHVRHRFEQATGLVIGATDRALKVKFGITDERLVDMETFTNAYVFIRPPRPQGDNVLHLPVRLRVVEGAGA